MIQFIPWDRLTLTGRLLLSMQGGAVTMYLLVQCLICMILDICIYFAATIFSYRLLVLTLFTPAERGFHCNDISIREQLVPNTVPTLVLLFFTLAGPFFIIIFAVLLRAFKCHFRDFAQLVNHSTYVYLDYVIGFWLMTIAIDVLKCFTGRIRPNFMAMCEPRELHEICATTPDAFVPVAHCTAGWKNSRNSKLSFPSGHASASVFCTLFLIFYLRGLQLRLPYFRLRLLFWTASTLSTLLTIYCCITRYTDCWHFLSDVLCGALFGAAMFYLLLHKYITSNITELKRVA